MALIMLLNKHKNFRNEKGFTLVEVMVVVFIFSIVIFMTISIFTVANKSQREVLEKYALQKEGAYLMEMMSRELRMATAINNVNGDQANLNGTEIEFTNYEGILVKYCKSLANGVCDASGYYVARNGLALNASKIKVSNFNVYTSKTFVGTRPLITISLNVKYNGGYQNEFYLQNSVALRLY